MHKYEDITIEVGFWSSDKTRRVEEVTFSGRLLASSKYLGEHNEYDDWGIHWAIYRTEEGAYIVYWFEWDVHYWNKVMADYAILDTLPGYNQHVDGIMWGPYLNPIPDNVIDEAKAALLAQDEEE